MTAKLIACVLSFLWGFGAGFIVTLIIVRLCCKDDETRGTFQ